jgi:thiamine biosynthesis lipoprotein
VDIPRQAWVEQIMGMPVSLHLRGAGVREDPAVPPAVAVVFKRLRAVDRLFSTYRPDSQVSRIRRGELPEDRWHPWVREVVGLCVRARERTDGYFQAWLPTGFDPSGLVKGWAVERAAALLSGLPYDHCLNAGGDIAARVHSPGSPPWRVGIEDPRDRTRILTVCEVRAGGVATSGSAARGAHILDPHTGGHPDELLSVTVTGPTLLWADVYATAAFARGGDVVSWLRACAPGYEALDHQRKTSARLPGPNQRRTS